MHSQSVLLSGHLAEAPQNRVEELTRLLNERVQPPNLIKPADIYIRSMYLVSDELNSYGGKFEQEELRQVVQKVIDAPVLIGHQKDSLPIGRNFHAELVTENGRQWVRTYFYWLKKAARSDDTRENIDGGVYKECSIGFVFSKPECSVCGDDIRHCRHELQKKYQESTEGCFFYYRNIEKVLETSLVYRGANPNTKITKALSLSTAIGKNDKQYQNVSQFHELLPHAMYLVTPFYQGIDIMISAGRKKVIHRLDNGACLPGWITDKLLPRQWHSPIPRFGRLIGMRGKERCSHENLIAYLDKETSPVSRLEIRLYPDLEHNTLDKKNLDAAVRLIRSVLISRNELLQQMRSMCTKEGVVVYPVTKTDSTAKAYHFTLKDINSIGSLRLQMIENYGAVLEVSFGQQQELFKVPRLNLKALCNGSRFLITSQIAGMPIRQSSTVLAEGFAFEKEWQESHCELRGRDILLRIEPVVLHNKKAILLSPIKKVKEHIDAGGTNE